MGKLVRDLIPKITARTGANRSPGNYGRKRFLRPSPQSCSKKPRNCAPPRQTTSWKRQRTFTKSFVRSRQSWASEWRMSSPVPLRSEPIEGASVSGSGWSPGDLRPVEGRPHQISVQT